jgi:ribonuclease Z
MICNAGGRAAGVLLLLAPASGAAAQDTRLILLGTGTPNPEPDHSGSAVAIVSGSRAYIVDAGPGVARRAAQGAYNGAAHPCVHHAPPL